MSNLAMCRMCLASNTKMHHIANTPYQEILENLVPELCTADGRTETVCWVCLSALRRGRRLADTARAAHEILTQLSLSGIPLSDETVSMLGQKFLCKITWTPIQNLSIDKEFIPAPIKVEIKEDPCENEETAGFISENEQINCTLGKDETFTVKNEETFCDNTSIEANEERSGKVISNEHQNEQSTIVISRDFQTTDSRSVIEPKNKVNKTHTENRSKSKSSSEVIVKDQKGQDCVRHTCQTCDKTYKQRCHLLRHLKTHRKTGSQPSGQPPLSLLKDVICEHCGKGFANNYTLKKHLLAHQDVKNFACAHCSIKFVQKSDLVRHIRIHTGQKPYKCDTCDKHYSQKSILVRHVRIHTEETPYSCERCGLNFNRHSSMVRHLKRRHFSSDKRRYKGTRRP